MRVSSPPPVYLPPPVEAPRPIDPLDQVTEGGYVDTHADVAFNNVGLKEKPGFMMRVFLAFIKFLSIFFPKLKNFDGPQVTREGMDQWPRGLQVMSTVTNGLPPFYRASAWLYTQAIANWPSHADATPFNAFIYQVGFIYRQLNENRDRLMLAPDATAAAAAMRGGMIGIQVAMEGAFPLEMGKDDLEKWHELLKNPKNGFPPGMPLPTDEEVSTYEGRLDYCQRINLAYIGLNHLASSQFAGSSLWPNERRGEGLTDAGQKLVRDMDKRGIMIDLAHASAQGQKDIIKLVDDGVLKGPIIVSHAEMTIDGQDPDWRATINDAVRVVKKTGGCVSVMGARAHLPHGSDADPLVLIRDMCDQVDYIKKLGGIDVISLGLDSEGFVGLPYATQSETLHVLKMTLKYERGYSDDEITKIFGGNYLHTLARRDANMKARAEPTTVTQPLAPVSPLALRVSDARARVVA